MHPAELGDELVIGIKPAQQPHQLHVAAALRLKTTRETQLMKIAIQIKLE